ncbi:unnamed protein product [Urochloa humidicola]
MRGHLQESDASDYVASNDALYKHCEGEVAPMYIHFITSLAPVQQAFLKGFLGYVYANNFFFSSPGCLSSR